MAGTLHFIVEAVTTIWAQFSIFYVPAMDDTDAVSQSFHADRDPRQVFEHYVWIGSPYLTHEEGIQKI